MVHFGKMANKRDLNFFRVFLHGISCIQYINQLNFKK